MTSEHDATRADAEPAEKTINEVAGKYGWRAVNWFAAYLWCDAEDRTAALIEREIKSRGRPKSYSLDDATVLVRSMSLSAELGSAAHHRLARIGEGGSVKFMNIDWTIERLVVASDIVEFTLRAEVD